MQTLHLSDVRCFRNSVDVPLTPLTFFVGENSAGKSTALALIRLAWDVAYSTLTPNFNEEPFLLGSYEHIAHYHGGRGKRTTSFSIGLTDKSTDGDSKVIARFIDSGGQPELDQWTLSSGNMSITLCLAGEQSGRASIQYKGMIIPIPKSLEFIHLARTLNQGPLHVIGFLAFRLHEQPELQEQIAQSASVTRDVIKTIAGILRRLSTFARGRTLRPYAMAPIRSRPSRTYEPTSATPTPEGTHTPTSLARIYRPSAPAQQAKQQELLKGFGSATGLFSILGVRRLGNSRKTSDPFQVTVRLPDQQGDRNIVDVGYGVSQVLPVVVDLLAHPSNVMLLQQPEVHLHPRAQAELGSFLAQRTNQSDRIIVETHSDYLIDRVSMAVRRQQIPAENVSVLFFDRNPSGNVDIHPLKYDSNGQLQDPPPQYRSFFLKEQDRLLGG